MFGALAASLLTLHAGGRATRAAFVAATVLYPVLIAAAFGAVDLGFFN